MSTSIYFKAILSLILVTAGCQTIKDSQDGAETSEVDTDLSVATAFLEGGRPDKALYALQSILEKHPKNVPAHTLMGLTQLALKNPPKAVEHLKIAWNLEPKSQNALNLSSAYLEAKQPDAAQKIILTGLGLKETPPYRHRERFFHNLGLVAQIKGRNAAAEKAFRKALEENPTFYLSRVQLAQMLGNSTRLEAAREQWELARSSCPACLQPVESLAKYYEKKGDLKTALGLIRDYKKIEGIDQTEAKRALQLEADLAASRAKLAKEAADLQSR